MIPTSLSLRALFVDRRALYILAALSSLFLGAVVSFLNGGFFLMLLPLFLPVTGYIFHARSGGIVVLSAAVLWAGLLLGLDYSLGVALAPLLVLIIGYVVITAALDHLALAIFGFMLLVDDTRSSPFMGLWESPLTKLGPFVYDTLEKSMGISSAKFFGLEVLVIWLFLGFGMQYRWGQKAPRQPATAMIMAALVGIAMIVVWELMGIARGGHLNYSLLQLRPMFFFCVMTILFSYILYRRSSIKYLLLTILIVGVVRAAVGIYFWQEIFSSYESAAGDGSYITTHQDTILWVTCVSICLIWFLHYPSLAPIQVSLVFLPLILVAISANNRRLVYVALILGLALLYLVIDKKRRRWVNVAMILAIPLMPFYIAAGWDSEGGWAKPVQIIRSVSESSDSSSEMRDIENFNLMTTLKARPLLGSGFGHEYNEYVVAYNISNHLEAYRYLPHNSLMWLLTAGGWLGFTLFWSIFVVGNFLAVRTYHLAKDRQDKILCLVTLVVSVTYMIQAFGDLGIQSWMSSLILSALYGAVASRSVVWRAWRNPGVTQIQRGQQRLT